MAIAFLIAFQNKTDTKLAATAVLGILTDAM
jgi:hypothetical protein